MIDKEKQNVIYGIIGILLMDVYRNVPSVYKKWVDLSNRLMDVDIENLWLFYDDLVKLAEATKAKMDRV